MLYSTALAVVAENGLAAALMFRRVSGAVSHVTGIPGDRAAWTFVGVHVVVPLLLAVVMVMNSTLSPATSALIALALQLQVLWKCVYMGVHMVQPPAHPPHVAPAEVARESAATMMALVVGVGLSSVLLTTAALLLASAGGRYVARLWLWAVALVSAGAYAAYLDPRGWLGINWTVIRPHPPPSNDSVKV